MATKIKPLRIIRLPEVVDRTGLSPTRIWEKEQAGEFPRRIKISSRAAGWLEHEIEAYIKRCVVRSRGIDWQPESHGDEADAGEGDKAKSRPRRAGKSRTYKAAQHAVRPSQ